MKSLSMIGLIVLIVGGVSCNRSYKGVDQGKSTDVISQDETTTDSVIMPHVVDVKAKPPKNIKTKIQQRVKNTFVFFAHSPFGFQGRVENGLPYGGSFSRNFYLIHPIFLNLLSDAARSPASDIEQPAVYEFTPWMLIN